MAPSTSFKPIFITARFRTGSSLLWHLLRTFPSLTTYYEPCHDNLFDHVAGDTPVQASHRGMSSYWDEYRPLLHALDRMHRTDFGVCRLLLEAADEWPELENYIRFLLVRSPGRPVLQFNRVDFRLPWLRARFPEAVIVHLFRDPRNQWRSMTRDMPPTRLTDPGENTNYDVAVWSVSLSKVFPFLVGPHICHPYQRHYLIWKLSFLMGAHRADVSLSYDEHFVRNPERGVHLLLDAVGLPLEAVSFLTPAIEPPTDVSAEHPTSVKEFADLEKGCDELLAELGLDERFGLVPVADIRREFAPAWDRFVAHAHEEAVHLASVTFSRERSRYLQTVSRLRELGENARNVQRELEKTERQLRQFTGQTSTSH